MTELDPGIVRAQEVYTKNKLAIYDFMVLQTFCRFVWRCSPRLQQKLYDDEVGERHLDVGPGTGYFLDKCRYPVAKPEITILDLSQECLDMTAKRIARYNPIRTTANLMEPLPLEHGYYDSVGMNLVFHTIPGGWEKKGIIFKHVAEVLKPGGVVFGTTVLSEGVPMNRLTAWLMTEQHRHGNFQNQGDDPEGLRAQLAKYFPNPQVQVVGCVGVFRAVAG